MPDWETTAPQRAGSATCRKSRKWLIAAAVLAFLTAVAVWGYRVLGADDKIASADAESKIKSVLHFETFVVNLDDPGQRSYLRIGIDLGLARNPKAKDRELPIAQLRDAILSVLSAARPEELQTPAGKTKLKADLLKALCQQAPQMGIEEVYFTEFLIQR